jgi:Ion transport protein
MRLLSLTKSIVKTNETLHHVQEHQHGNEVLHDSQEILVEPEDSEIITFYNVCSQMTEGDDQGWEWLRTWLRTHDEQQVQEGVMFRDAQEMTALHCISRNDPPEDVINTMLEFGAEALDMPDTFGWLPLHYACACGASSEVIMRFNEESPFSKTVVDRRGRAPIHFALSNLGSRRTITPEIVASLINTGSSTYPDDTGMLPLHYACAYGADDEVIQALIEANPDGLLAMDDRGRTPLVFCLANCDRDYAAAAARFMLETNQDVVNRYEGTKVPLQALADHAHHIKDPAGMVNASKCLECYMHTEPLPTADLISAIQQLPDWLLEEALHLHIVQVLLNQKTSQPFPTAVLMFDFYILTMTIVSFSILIVRSIQVRSDDDPYNNALDGAILSPLYIGISYFILRELIQLVGVTSLGALSTYIADGTNLIDIVYISLLLVWSICMHTGQGDLDVFRTGTALTLGLVWMNFLIYLQNVMIDLAIFVAGVTYVVQRLGAFLLATVIILVAFAQIFLTLYQETPYCNDYQQAKDVVDVACGVAIERPWCSFLPAFAHVLNMMLGAVEASDFPDSQAAIFFLIVFFFMVVILLTNVLIAIVTESYSVVRNERAAIVFWTNRLDFVGEMDAIAHGPWTRQAWRWLRLDKVETQKAMAGERSTFGSKTWRQMLDMFEDEVDQLSWWSREFWTLFFSRVFVAFVILPVWILLGLVTAGLLWPPEVREYVFVEAIATRLSNAGDESVEQQRLLEVETIQEDLEDLSDELALQLATDRANIAQLKVNLHDFRLSVLGDIKMLKERMSRAIEQNSRLNDSVE